MRSCEDGSYNWNGHYKDHFSKFLILWAQKRKCAQETITCIERFVFAFSWCSKNSAFRQWERLIKPKWLLEAKIGSYKLYDTSFLSLILKNQRVSDDVSLLTGAAKIYSIFGFYKQCNYVIFYWHSPSLYRLSQHTCTC